MADDVGANPFIFGWDVGAESDTTVIGQVNPDGSVTFLDISERIHPRDALEMEKGSDGVYRLKDDTHG